MDPNVALSLRAPEIDSLIELLQTAFPENEKIKTGVIPLLSNKKAYVKTLLDLWDIRIVPPLSAMEVQQICNQFYRDHSDQEAMFQMSYGDVRTNMATKLQKHILYKTSMGEKLSVDKLCSFIESSAVFLS